MKEELGKIIREYESQKAEGMQQLLSSVQKVLEDAKVDNVSQLAGKPIILTSEGPGCRCKWSDFRILTEVL